MYSTGNVVNNIIITLVTDSNYVYLGDRFAVYRNIEPHVVYLN